MKRALLQEQVGKHGNRAKPEVTEGVRGIMRGAASRDQQARGQQPANRSR